MAPRALLPALSSAAALLAVARAQQAGTLQPETHPSLTTYTCSTDGSCTSVSSSVTLDMDWRWIHSIHSSTNCYTGDQWDKDICPDPLTCAQNCAAEGADYSGTYGVTTNGDALSIKLVTVGQYDTNIGARLFVMEDDEHYQMFKLKNREFAFDVDTSTLGCGINGALYFVDMPADGGSGAFPTNRAGAKFGAAYCDSQCPRDGKFVNGLANILEYIPSPDGDPNSGWGEYGSCCTEFDVWEANSISSAVTPHMCKVDGPYRCDSNNASDCGTWDGPDRYLGVCDRDGTDLAPFRTGNPSFYGPGAGPAGGCSLQPGMNNMGTILAPPTLETDPVACCALCNATAGCVGFTFVASTSNCFLKSKVGTPIADPDATSGANVPPPSGGSVDTTQPFTVVTQMLTTDGTDAGDLVEIRRFFVQNGKKIPHPVATNIPGNHSSITAAFSRDKAAAFGDNDNFDAFGGLKRMGEVMDGGMVLVLSQWVDYEVHMLWLDAVAYPANASTTKPGVARGTCAVTSGDPNDVIKNQPDATVTFSNIRTGPIGFTEARLAREEADRERKVLRG